MDLWHYNYIIITSVYELLCPSWNSNMVSFELSVSVVKASRPCNFYNTHKKPTAPVYHKCTSINVNLRLLVTIKKTLISLLWFCRFWVAFFFLYIIIYVWIELQVDWITEMYMDTYWYILTVLGSINLCYICMINLNRTSRSHSIYHASSALTQTTIAWDRECFTPFPRLLYHNKVFEFSNFYSISCTWVTWMSKLNSWNLLNLQSW